MTDLTTYLDTFERGTLKSSILDSTNSLLPDGLLLNELHLEKLKPLCGSRNLEQLPWPTIHPPRNIFSTTWANVNPVSSICFKELQQFTEIHDKWITSLTLQLELDNEKEPLKVFQLPSTLLFREVKESCRRSWYHRSRFKKPIILLQPNLYNTK